MARSKIIKPPKYSPRAAGAPSPPPVKAQPYVARAKRVKALGGLKPRRSKRGMPSFGNVPNVQRPDSPAALNTQARRLSAANSVPKGNAATNVAREAMLQAAYRKLRGS